MHDHDLALDGRLAAMEARVPAAAQPPALPDARRRGRFAASLAMAPVLVLGLVATAAAGAAVVANLAHGYPGIQNPGQPMAGVHMECMTPREAAAALAAHGFTTVVWQIEGGDPNRKLSDGNDATTSVQQAVPPEHGYVIPGSLLPDGSVIMIVDQRVGATGVGDCFGHPMP